MCIRDRSVSPPKNSTGIFRSFASFAKSSASFSSFLFLFHEVLWYPLAKCTVTCSFSKALITESTRDVYKRQPEESEAVAEVQEDTAETTQAILPDGTYDAESVSYKHLEEISMHGWRYRRDSCAALKITRNSQLHIPPVSFHTSS